MNVKENVVSFTYFLFHGTVNEDLTCLMLCETCDGKSEYFCRLGLKPKNPPTRGIAGEKHLVAHAFKGTVS
jgi:hypothetical protein